MRMSSWRKAIRNRRYAHLGCVSFWFTPAPKMRSISRSPISRAKLLSGDARFYDRRRQIAELAVRHAIATCLPYREQVVAGGLMSYGADITDTFRQAGNYV